MTNAEELTRRQLLALRAAALLHGAALLWVSPWLHPLECAALVIGVAALPEIRWSSPTRTLAVRVGGALSVAAIAAALSARASIGAPQVLFDLTAFAFVAATHAPAWIVRHSPRASLATSAPEQAEVIGASMVATALALSSANPWRTAWTTGLCAAVGIAAVAWAWRRWVQQRAWRLPAHEQPPPGVLPVSSTEAPYRASGLRTSVARADGAWWRRRLLVPATALLTFAVVYGGAGSVLALRPERERGQVTRAMRAVMLGDDPCQVGALRGGRRDFGDPADPRTSVRGRHGSVWSSGAFYLVEARNWSPDEVPMHGGCASAELAQRWIEHRDRDEQRDRELLGIIIEPQLNDPDYRVERPPPCPPRRWCSIAWQGQMEGGHGDGDYGRRWDACTLRIDGRFQLGEVYERWGRIPAARARALIEAIERVAGVRGWSRLTSRPSESMTERGDLQPPEFLVNIGGVGLRRVEFPHARAIGEALSRQLCERLPPQADPLPDTHIVLPDGL